jgi:hypothetical protein
VAHDNFKLLPILQVKLDDFWQVHQHFQHVAEVPAAFLVQRAVSVSVKNKSKSQKERLLVKKSHEKVQQVDFFMTLHD